MRESGSWEEVYVNLHVHKVELAMKIARSEMDLAYALFTLRRSVLSPIDPFFIPN